MKVIERRMTYSVAPADVSVGLSVSLPDCVGAYVSVIKYTTVRRTAADRRLI